MSEELRELIERINEEGVKAAELHAGAIEEEARRQAAAIVERAKVDAAALMAEAKEKAARLDESTRRSLRQAGRDLLIELRKEISDILDSLIASHVHKALGPEEMTKLIISLVKDAGLKGAGIVVSARKEDADKLERSLLSELRLEAKKGITLKAADDIRGGFRISYDEGRSYYDFTDQALADYIGSSLKPRLGEIFSETDRTGKK